MGSPVSKPINLGEMVPPSGRFDAFRVTAVPPDREAAMRWAFPDVVPYVRPLGTQIVVQLRRSPKHVGLILKPDETKDAEQYKVQIARALLFGPGCFLNRTTGEIWPELLRQEAEDAIVTTGTFVRIPQAGLDRWLQTVPGEVNEDPVMLALIRDTDIKAIWTADPLHQDTARSGW